VFLSIIIPAYNEQERLPQTIERVVQFINTQKFSSEILIVDNASTDSTFYLAERYSHQYNNVRVIQESRKGKGNAIRTGMLEAQGRYRFMCDADLSMPIEEIIKFLPPLCDSDVSIGSREAPGAIRYNEPFSRHLSGRIFNLLTRIFILPNLNDTQCGFKCFKDDVAKDIFQYQTIGGWAFDVEILYIAEKRGYSIIEVPISWYYRENSKINTVQDSLQMINEIIKICRNDKKGFYDIY